MKLHKSTFVDVTSLFRIMENFDCLALYIVYLNCMFVWQQCWIYEVFVCIFE